MKIDAEIDVHLHDGSDRLLHQILDRLTQMEIHMTDINSALTANTAALTAMAGRIDEDVAHLQDLLAQALATDVANAAEVARLTAEAEAAVASINANTAQLASIDPVAEFPATTPVTPTP